MSVYNSFVNFYNLESQGFMVPNNFQMEIQILSSIKSVSLKLTLKLKQNKQKNHTTH